MATGRGGYIGPVHKAVMHFNEQLEKNPGVSKNALINDASLKYNLSVSESELFVSLINKDTYSSSDKDK